MVTESAYEELVDTVSMALLTQHLGGPAQTASSACTVARLSGESCQ